tara:strand:+ start:102 stop:491 length:390 start_codon:yes stop_codon:yes gene_type:complete
MNTSVEKELISHVYENIKDYVGLDVNDLCHHLFNEDYYVIGYYNAEQWLLKHGLSAFKAIAIVKEYEEQNFGELYTDISSSEKVVNMIAYIYGEEILHSSDTAINASGELSLDLAKNIVDEILEKSNDN